MAHFAELDINNKVIRVLTACNQDIANNGGEQSEQAALHFQSLNNFSSNGVKWVQTSYNNNFRKRYASIGYTYDLIKDKFISPKPYTSWSLDTNDDWQAPIAYPTVLLDSYNKNYIISWNENEQKWTGIDSQNNTFSWSPDTLSWIATGN
jgi:hypothetical protein